MTIYYASPDGTENGLTYSHPMAFSTAISQTSPLSDGDVCFMLAGDYVPLTAGETGLDALNGEAGVAGKGVYIVKHGGISDYITFKNYPGQRVRIIGGMHLQNGDSANYIRFQGDRPYNFEIEAIPTTRVFPLETDLDIPPIYITASHVGFINCFIHDHYHIFLMPEVAGGVEISGCILGYTGFYESDFSRYRASTIYAHNDLGGDMLLQNNLLVGCYLETQIDVQSASDTNIKDFYVQDNICFHGGILLGSAYGTNLSNNHINRNHIYSKLQDLTTLGAEPCRVVGYNNTYGLGEDVEATENYFVTYGDDDLVLSAIKFHFPRYSSVERNTFIAAGVFDYAMNYHPPSGTITSVSLDYNTYYYQRSQPIFNYMIASRQTPAQWMSMTGFDLNSTWINALPTTNKVVVNKNSYNPGGFVGIYNWENLDNVQVDISSLGLTVGSTCRYYNALNYPNEYGEFIYDGSSISVPMNGWTLRYPIANDVPDDWPDSPYPQFGMFSIEEVSIPVQVSIKTPKIRIVYNEYATYGIGGIASLRKR